MSAAPVLFFFDFADPISWVVELELRAAGAAAVEIERVPLELRPPPHPLLEPGDPHWLARLRRAAGPAEALGLSLAAPALLPWTRKAHELVLHARASEGRADLILPLYRALFEEGADIGRVDVLVDLAARHGLDRTRTKTVLDIDTHAAEVAEGRPRARAAGIDEPPALVAGGRCLQGFHNRDALGTFLESTRTQVR